MTKFMLSTAVVGLAMMQLGACARTGGYQHDKYHLPEGSLVELTQTLQFPGSAARVYIQSGEIRKWGDVIEWSPYCSFGLNRKRDDKPLVREVDPGIFEVTGTRVELDISRSFDDRAPGTLPDDRTIRVAGVFGGNGARRGGTPSLYIYRTTITLYSGQQPQLDDLTCAYRGSPRDRNLTVDDIRKTLDGVARIY